MTSSAPTPARPLIAAFETAARSAISLGAQVIIPGEGPLNVLLASNGVNRVDDVPVLDSSVRDRLCEVRARQYRGQGCGRHAVASSSPPTGRGDRRRPSALSGRPVAKGARQAGVLSRTPAGRRRTRSTKIKARRTGAMMNVTFDFTARWHS